MRQDEIKNLIFTSEVEKFPAGYTIQLIESEKNELVENFDRFKILKHSTVYPIAFTDKDLYMLATILRSANAVATTKLQLLKLKLG